MKQRGTPAGTVTNPPASRSLREIRCQLRSGELTPTELLERCLERIADTEAAGAFVLTDPDGARAAAASIDPHRSGPLAGIPVAVKDLVDVAGWPTRAGRRDGRTATVDAPVVAALRHAGAVIVGKTRTDEIGLGTFTPGAHDPRDPARSVGGSSGGSALAVALGAAILAVATDTAGSARIPAAACGVAGLCRAGTGWPTDGVVGLSPRFDRLGLIASDAADLVEAWRCLSGPTETVRPNRVHVPAAETLGRVDPERAEAANTAARRLAATVGGQPHVLPGPAPREFGADRALVVTADAAARHAASAAESELVRTQLLDGSRHSDLAIEQAWHRLKRLGTALRAGIGAGVLVLPTLPSPPPVWDELADLDAQLRHLGRLTRLCAPVNSAGLVAASVPWSADPSGNPIGIQLVAATEPILCGALEALPGPHE